METRKLILLSFRERAIHLNIGIQVQEVEALLDQHHPGWRSR